MVLTKQDKRIIEDAYDRDLEQMAKDSDWRAKMRLWCQEEHRRLAILSWRADKMLRDAELTLKDCNKILKSEPSDEMQTDVAITRWKAAEMEDRASHIKCSVNTDKVHLKTVSHLIGFSYTDI